MITVQRIQHPEGFDIAFNIVIDTQDSMNAFKKLVQRATNLWPDATPEIKEFADLITVGTVQQDYKAQDTSVPTKEKKKHHNITRIIPRVHNDLRLVVCGCGVSREITGSVETYVCENCKSVNNLKDYVK